jgi:hypothetical protein
MESRIVLVTYRPLPGKEQLLISLLKKHLDVLGSQDLVTDRKPIVMKASDGSIVEIFEWRSAKAIEAAHTNALVQALWGEFSKVCTYEKAIDVAEFHNLFSEFEPVSF